MDDILDLYIKAFTATMTCYSHELPSTKRLRLAFWLAAQQVNWWKEGWTENFAVRIQNTKLLYK